MQGGSLTNKLKAGVYDPYAGEAYIDSGRLILKYLGNTLDIFGTQIQATSTDPSVGAISLAASDVVVDIGNFYASTDTHFEVTVAMSGYINIGAPAGQGGAVFHIDGSEMDLYAGKIDIAADISFFGTPTATDDVYVDGKTLHFSNGLFMGAD
jgi:hypothetical protein